MTIQEQQSQLDKLKKRIPYDTNVFLDNDNYEDTLKQLLDDSESVALSDLYPFEDWSIKTLPKKLYNWQLRACKELYTYLGKEGIKSYSENGLSFSRIKDGLSQDLENEIMPNAGFISKKTTQGGTE